MSKKVGPGWVKRAAHTVRQGENVKGLGVVKKIEQEDGSITFTGDGGRMLGVKASAIVAVQMFSLGF